LALASASEGNLDGAIAAAELVPPNTPVYPDAQEAIAGWRNQTLPEPEPEAAPPPEAAAPEPAPEAAAPEVAPAEPEQAPVEEAPGDTEPVPLSDQ
jgi:hypothetical protein